LPLIGIMQGRMLPPEAGRIQCFPRAGWREEFALAAAAGLQRIEWIYDASGADVNPLATDEGIAEIISLSKNTGVEVRSLVADYFMDFPLVRATTAEFDERVEKLKWLVKRAALAGIERITIPFVDASRIEGKRDSDDVVAAVNGILPAARDAKIEIHLETALGPAEFASILERLSDPLVRVNYDSGNSASLGYDVRAEFAAYGSRVGSVHIKDRVRGGGTVPLGSGDADLPALAECLGKIRYDRDLILQVARGVPGGEMHWMKKNRQYVADLFKDLPSEARL